MDDELTLHELQRLEAERRLLSIPEGVLETAWVRSAQVEAVIDAVLAVTFGADAAGYAHARHVGEWCARIAARLAYAPGPSFARRAGVLCDVDPAALDRIRELEHLATYVREYQNYAMKGSENPRTLSVIVAVADEFATRVAQEIHGRTVSPNSVLRTMIMDADETSRPVLDALMNVVHQSKSARVA